MTFRPVLPTRTARRASFAATAIAGVTVLAACGTAPADSTAAFAPATKSASSPATSAPSPSAPASSSPSATSSTTSPSASPSSTTSRAAKKDTSRSATRAPKKDTSRSSARPKATTRASAKTSLVTKTVRLAPNTIRKTDTNLTKGKTKVLRAGVSGRQVLTVRRTTVANRVTDTDVIKRVTTKKAVNRIVAVGTKAKATSKPKSSSKPSRNTGTSSTSGMDLRRSGMWAKIAACESGGNWSINTGNGYYGGLQFNAGTWLANGGGKFAPRADLASKAQQITIANHLYDRAGGQPWGCS